MMTLTIVQYRAMLNSCKLCEGCGRLAACRKLRDKGRWPTSGTGKREDYRIGERWADGHFVSRGALDCMAYIAEARGIKVENRVEGMEAKA